MDSKDIFIRDYYNSRLDAAQTAEFEARYRNDDTFKAEADQLKIEILGIRAASRKQLKGKFAQWEQEAESTADTRKSGFMRIVAMAAAIVVAISYVMYLLQSPASQELYLSYYQPYPNYEYTVSRDDVEIELSLTDSAYIQYDAKNYKQAAMFFSLVKEKDQGNVPATFFRGMCYIEMGQWANAINDLQTIVDISDTDYSQPARWYMAMVYLQNGNLGACRDTLRLISNQKGEYQEQAKKLLESL